ncbi:MAG: hypothetical protein ABMA15_04220 [Vicinamibacterales bacterium]
MTTAVIAVPSPIAVLVESAAALTVSPPINALRATGVVDTTRGNGLFTESAPADTKLAGPRGDTSQSPSRIETKPRLRDILRYHIQVIDAVMRSN